MVSRVLSDFASEEIEEFRLDFVRLLEITVELDKEFGTLDEELMYNIPVYKNFVSAFNTKYPGVYCHFEEKSEGFMLHILFRSEPDVRKVFVNVASQIEGLSAIGNQILEEDSIYNKREFNLELKQIKTKLYIRFTGDDSLFLKYNKQFNMVELIYKPEDIINRGESPGFVICVYYALREGYKSGMDLLDIAGKFSSTAMGATRNSLEPQK